MKRESRPKSDAPASKELDEVANGSKNLDDSCPHLYSLSRAIFLRPQYSVTSTWLSHIPFIFWIMEAHRPKTVVQLNMSDGVSYFAICQSVKHFNIQTKCNSIISFDNEIESDKNYVDNYNEIRALNESTYTGFSKLIECPYGEAANRFIDGSIDLLNIDKFSNLSSAGTEFKKWIPKLSDESIVLVHGTNFTKKGSAASELFHSLSQEYPAFEFLHGDGLGVLLIGNKQKKSVSSIMKENSSDVPSCQTREIFSYLGQACVNSQLATCQDAERALIVAEILKQKREVNDLTILLEQANMQIKNHRESQNTLSSILIHIATGNNQQRDLKKSANEASALLEAVRSEMENLSRKIERTFEKEQSQPSTVKSKTLLENRLYESEDVFARTKDEPSKYSTQLSQEIATVKSERTRLQEILEEKDRELALLAKFISKSKIPQYDIYNGEKFQVQEIAEPDDSAKTNAKSKKRDSVRMEKIELSAANTFKIIKDSNLFDPEWYLAQNMDVAKLNLDPLFHYVNFGAKEGRDPSSKFSALNHIKKYPKIIELEINPFAHHILLLQHQKKNL